MRLLRASLALVLLAGVACSQRDDDDDSGTGGEGESAAAEGINTDDCAADPNAEIEGDTLKLVSSFPQSGITSAFAQIANGWNAYFEKINAEGGVEIAGKKYQIEHEAKDDTYEAGKTAQNISEMVGTDADPDEAFAAFSVVGTVNNLGIRQSLNDLCVPNLFAATGSPAWGNPEWPWTIGSTLSPYSLEGDMFASLLKEENPDAKVAMLVQDDDFGKAYEESFKAAIEGTDIELVQVESYPTGEDEVTSQITSLANSGADTFFNGGTLLACPYALQNAAAANWEREFTWVSSTCLSKTLMGIANEAAADVYSAANVMDPLSPEWEDDPRMQEYQDVIGESEPAYLEEIDANNSIVAYGWTQAAVFVEALEQAEAASRLAVMDSVRNLEVDDSVGLLLPGTSVKTSAEDDDFFMGETTNLVQYNFQGSADESWFDLVDEVVDYEGKSADVTPEELINS